MAPKEAKWLFMHKLTLRGLLTVALASFVAMLSLPTKRWDWIQVVWMVSSAATATFVGADDKPKVPWERLKNAIVACVAIGAFCALFYGAPGHDEDGDLVYEGFKTTFDSRSGAGVKVFLELFSGAAIGIYLADFFREPDTP